VPKKQSGYICKPEGTYSIDNDFNMVMSVRGNEAKYAHKMYITADNPYIMYMANN